ncbi:MAG TPA: hypothetical protein PK024_00945 [Methanospirillum sp.]|uniref:hypothetical protein n=1 Tax=Methanospirillum sp. TaxID=45200 RepID=UPI002D12A16A|nr:hypothetical protein [Methanospirillum sp.]HOJ95397.1 hypothetical protein [Methanospirillum sp.]
MAILVVLIMAMYIKPLVTGKEAKLVPDEISNIFSKDNETDILLINNSSINGSSNASVTNNSIQEIIVNESIKNKTELKNNTSVAPIPTQWDGNPVQVGYSYTDQGGIIIPRSGPVSEFQPYSFLQKPEMILFTEFSGKYPISTNIFEIPKTSGYWEIEYTVDYQSGLQEAQGTEKKGDYPLFQFNKERKVVVEDGETKEKVIIKGGEWSEEDYTGTGEFVESVSLLTPSIRIDVIQHENNNSKIIRTITPDGGLDPYLWNKAVIKEKMKENSKLNGQEIDDKILEERVKKIVDPRPWTEKFYERGNFSLNIFPSYLKSYDVKVKVSKGIQTPEKNNQSASNNQLTDTLSLYIQRYNADVNSPDYINNILETIDTSKTSRDQIIQKILTTKTVVPQITKYSVYSTNTAIGNLRGDIYYTINNHEKWMPLDLYLVYFGDKWKLPEPVLPRY